MEKNLGTFKNVDFIKISPDAMQVDNWLRKWQEEVTGKFARIYHVLFGYRRDPGNAGVKRALTPLTVQLVARSRNRQKSLL